MFAKKYVDVIEESNSGDNKQPREIWVVKRKINAWPFDLLIYIEVFCKEEGNNSFSRPRAQVVMLLGCNPTSL